MTKEQTARQIVDKVLEFMVDNDHINFTHYPTSRAKPGKKQANIPIEDIEQLQAIAQGNMPDYFVFRK